MKMKRKRLGQHFLVRPSLVVNWFRSRICGRKQVVEIGAGEGALTRRVSDCVGYLVALEVDENLAANLHTMLSLLGLGHAIEIVVSDATRPPVRLKAFNAVFGNIPYSITSQLLELLVKEFQGPVYIMVQREVAKRLAARPGTNDYGRLTVLVQLVYTVSLGTVVPPNAFRPPPKVYSQLVELIPRQRCDPEFIACLEELTRCMFSARRKLARKIARNCLNNDSVEEIVGDRRVYELTVEEWYSLGRLAGCRGDCASL